MSGGAGDSRTDVAQNETTFPSNTFHASLPLHPRHSTPYSFADEYSYSIRSQNPRLSSAAQIGTNVVRSSIARYLRGPDPLVRTVPSHQRRTAEISFASDYEQSDAGFPPISEMAEEDPIEDSSSSNDDDGGEMDGTHPGMTSIQRGHFGNPDSEPTSFSSTKPSITVYSSNTNTFPEHVSVPTQTVANLATTWQQAAVHPVVKYQSGKLLARCHLHCYHGPCVPIWYCGICWPCYHCERCGHCPRVMGRPY